jgi:arginyl-tRNA synthetase
MDIFSIEREDNIRLSDTFPRETVSLVLKVSEQVHKETLKDLQKRKTEADKDIILKHKSIKDLKKVIAEIASSEDCGLSEIFEQSEFMKNQKQMIPTEMLTFSLDKFESQIQKSLTRLTISLDKLQSKSESLEAIIKDHQDSKNSTMKKVAKLSFLKSYFLILKFT